jgi:hypothetical protein
MKGIRQVHVKEEEKKKSNIRNSYIHEAAAVLSEK